MDNEQQEENNNNPVGSLIAHGVMSGVGVEKDDQEGNEESFPLPTTNEVLQCQISSWYEKFSSIVGHPRKNVTIKSIIIDKLPIDFREYLLSDGVRLPVDATNLSSFAPPESADDNDEWSSDEDENNNADNNEQESECTEPPKQFHFPDLNERIITAIEALKGSVIPKLNWSTPKDAVWVNGGSLKCTTAGDIYLLVKSSDFCLHDVQMHALEDCAHDDSDVNDKSKDQTTAAIEIQPHPELQLTLRKWCNLYPSMEFRCFIRHHEIVAISQRNHTQHYPHLLRDKDDIQSTVLTFFDEYVQNQFADGMVSRYVLDVYIDQKQRVWIVDFNVWGKSTDTLLFEWSELLTLDVEDEPTFRIVETAQEVRQDPLSSYRAPIDTVDLASMTTASSQFEEFMKQCERPSQRS